MSNTGKRYTKQPTAEILATKYGLLTPMHELQYTDRRKFECKCDCGGTKIALLTSLKTGKTKSCGCLQKNARKHNIQPGDKFGRLTVVKEGERVGPAGAKQKTWLCECSCDSTYSKPRPKDEWVTGLLGTTLVPADPLGHLMLKQVRQSALVSGRTKSCGCVRSEHMQRVNEEFFANTDTESGLVDISAVADTTPED